MKKIILEKLKILQEQKKRSKFWNITWDQGIFLSNLIELKKPESVLEIGTSNGFSALWLLVNLSEGSSLDTIEVNDERFNLAKQNFKDAGVKNITQHLGEVFEVLPRLQKKFDFIFIDAAHQFYRELLEKIEELELLKEGFTIVFDNVSTHKHLTDFSIYAKKMYSAEHIDIGGGFLVVKSKK